MDFRSGIVDHREMLQIGAGPKHQSSPKMKYLRYLSNFCQSFLIFKLFDLWSDISPRSVKNVSTIERAEVFFSLNSPFFLLNTKYQN